jgi:5-methylcytosine-specific restriction endonuclease McrA
MVFVFGCNERQIKFGGFQLAKRKTWNGGNWTEGRFNSFITSTLRAGARRWQPKYDTLNSSKTEKKINPKTGRMAQHYECGLCHNEFTQKDMEVDHIKPVVDPSKGFISWDIFIDRLFCEADNLQAICKSCHLVKTKKEKKERTDANK